MDGARRIPRMPLIDENVPPIEKVDLAITWWENEHLRNMHLAAMRGTAGDFYLSNQYLSNSLRCNKEMNELFRQRNEIAEIAKRHALESLMRFYLRHPVFKNTDLRPVLRLIFQFACTPGYALVSR